MAVSDEEQKPVAFCLKEIADSKSLIVTIAAQFPKLRAAYEKYKGTGLKRENDSLIDLQKTAKRLVEEFPALVLRLDEYGDSELSKTAERLYGVLKKFNYLGTTAVCFVRISRIFGYINSSVRNSSGLSRSPLSAEGSSRAKQPKGRKS